MNKTGGKIVLWGLIIAMLVFTAIRTIHFLQLTFPPDQQYVAYLGLAAFDVGVLGWFYFATESAEGTLQRVIAYGMIFICAGGVLATTITDMTLVSSQNGLAKIPKDMATLGLWAVIIVISLDFLAGILAHLADPSHQKHFEMQNAKDVIHATTMQHIKQQAHTIAPQIAAQVSEYWAQQVAAEMTGQIPGKRQPMQLAPPTVQGSLVTPPIQQLQSASLAQEAKIESVEDKPNPVQRFFNVFASKDTEDATQGSKSAMQQWMDLYKKSGDDAAMSFPDWLRMVQESAPDDPPKK